MARGAKRGVTAQTAANDGSASKVVYLSIPAWLTRLADEQARLRGGSRSDVLRDWIFEQAKAQYPDRIPASRE